jgi:hypothetical protein
VTGDGLEIGKDLAAEGAGVEGATDAGPGAGFNENGVVMVELDPRGLEAARTAEGVIAGLENVETPEETMEEEEEDGLGGSEFEELLTALEPVGLVAVGLLALEDSPFLGGGGVDEAEREGTGGVKRLRIGARPVAGAGIGEGATGAATGGGATGEGEAMSLSLEALLLLSGRTIGGLIVEIVVDFELEFDRSLVSFAPPNRLGAGEAAVAVLVLVLAAGEETSEVDELLPEKDPPALRTG